MQNSFTPSGACGARVWTTVHFLTPGGRKIHGGREDSDACESTGLHAWWAASGEAVERAGAAEPSLQVELQLELGAVSYTHLTLPTKA